MAGVTERAARGAAMMMAARACFIACSYVVTIVLARGLGPAEYGVYGIVFSVLLGVELIGRLGVPQSVSKLVAEDDARARSLEASGVTLCAAIFFGIFGLFWLAAPSLAAALHVAGGTRLFRIAALDIPVYGLYFICAHVLNGRREFGRESLGHCLYGVTKAAGVLLLLYLGLTVAAALVVNVAASAVALVYVGWRAGGSVFVPTLTLWRPILLLAVPVGLFGLGTQLLQNLDLWLLNGLGTQVADETKGVYVAALNVARIPKTAAFIMTAVLVPSISRAIALGVHEEVERSVKGAMRFLAILLLPACALVAVEAEPLMRLFFSASYAGYGYLLALLVFAHGLCQTVQLTFGAILIGGGKAKIAAWINLGLVPVAAVAAAVLIRAYGATGAAAGALAFTLLGMLLAGAAVRRHVSRLLAPAALAKTLAATGAAALLVWSVRLPGAAVLVELAGVGLLYAASLPILGLVTRGDLAPFLPGSRRRKRAERPVDPAASGMGSGV